MDGNARKYALLVLLLDYGTAERLRRNCLDMLGDRERATK